MARARRGISSGFGDSGPLPPPPKLRNRAGRSSAYRKPAGPVAKAFAVFGVVLMFALGVFWFVSGAVNLTYRAGWAGTPGVVRAVECFDVGSGRDESLQCSGYFTSTDGRVVLPDVDIEGSTDFSGLGARPAALHGDGATVSVVGAKTVAFILCGMLFALLPVELFGFLGVMIVVTAVRRWAGGPPWRQPKRMGRILLWTMVATAVSAVAAGIVGATVG
jgi:hypothetical protein